MLFVVVSKHVKRFHNFRNANVIVVVCVSIIKQEGDMAEKKYIKIGTKVTTRFGEAKVTGIELCESMNDKYGIGVDKIYAADKDRCVFDMDNGHWAYGWQVSYA